jgi:hypothetical protein
VFSKLFWKDTAERVIASAAGGALAVLTMSATDVTVDGKVWLLGVGVPALTSLLKALVASGKHDTISPASFAAVKPPEQPAEPA